MIVRCRRDGFEAILFNIGVRCEVEIYQSKSNIIIAHSGHALVLFVGHDI